MERLLITGIDSPLGCNLAARLADRAEVLGVYGQEPIESSHLRTAACDLTDRRSVAALVESWGSQAIVHCGPLSANSWDSAPDTSLAEQEPRVVAQLAQIASDAGIRLTVISSDVVFAGPRMFHEESSAARSPSDWAAQVLAMERALTGSKALVVRTHAYGWSPTPDRAGFAERAFEALAAGLSFAADGRRHATPILATDLADLLWRAHELRLHGLYHLAGAERTSAAGFVAELAAASGLPNSLEWSAGDAPTRPAWHEETSLNSKRARRALERSTPMLREGLERFIQQATDGWRDGWHTNNRLCAAREVAA